MPSTQWPHLVYLNDLNGGAEAQTRTPADSQIPNRSKSHAQKTQVSGGIDQLTSEVSGLKVAVGDVRSVDAIHFWSRVPKAGEVTANSE